MLCALSAASKLGIVKEGESPPRFLVRNVDRAHLCFNAPTTVLCTRSESILVVQELGIQKRTRYVGGREKHVFIDKSKIKSIIINEGARAGPCTVFASCF